MENLENVIEGILFVAGEGVALFDIADKLNVNIEEVKLAVNNLKKQKEDLSAGIQVILFNDKAQLCSNPSYAEPIAEVLNPIKEKALTKAVLEVAAIVAYKQPVTRIDIENVRGVNSDYAVSMLMDNGLIEVVGRKDAVGKPLLFGTTDKFLKKFNLQSINDLPDYEQLLERIAVIHDKNSNSLFNFEDVADDLAEHANQEIDIEKLKQQVIKEVDQISDIVDSEVGGDYVNYVD